MKPTAELISHPTAPIETLFVLWRTSRDDSFTLTPEDVAWKMAEDQEYHLEVEKEVFKILDAGVSVIDNLHFTFRITGVPISLREQMVRHRLGVKMEGRLGADLIPDLHDSNWWAQSMRVLDMGTFHDSGAYHVPTDFPDKATEQTYHDAMLLAQNAYNRLVQAGVPVEEARCVLPLGCTHTLSWTLNLNAIRHILSKRSCWILQLSFWGPLIRSMIDELVNKIHPMLRRLVDPPCIDRQTNKYKGCVVRLDNEYRIQGRDPLPPCPLYMREQRDEAVGASEAVPLPTWRFAPDKDGGVTFQGDDIEEFKMWERMRADYAQFWDRSTDIPDQVWVKP